MASKRCPACKLVNPATANDCDCGYSFVDGSIGKSLLPPKPRESHPFDDPRVLRFVIRAVIALVAFMIIGLVECSRRH